MPTPWKATPSFSQVGPYALTNGPAVISKAMASNLRSHRSCSYRIITLMPSGANDGRSILQVYLVSSLSEALALACRVEMKNQGADECVVGFEMLSLVDELDLLFANAKNTP